MRHCAHFAGEASVHDSEAMRAGHNDLIPSQAKEKLNFTCVMWRFVICVHEYAALCFRQQGGSPNSYVNLLAHSRFAHIMPWCAMRYSCSAGACHLRIQQILICPLGSPTCIVKCPVASAEVHAQNFPHTFASTRRLLFAVTRRHRSNINSARNNALWKLKLV